MPPSQRSPSLPSPRPPRARRRPSRSHEFPAEIGGFAVAVADFNADSDPDLAIANSFADTVTAHLGGAGATFGAPTLVNGGDNDPVAVATGDFNDDSDPDIASANFTSNTVWVTLGAAGGSFGTPTPYAAGANPSGVAIGDFNADSDPDLAVSNRATDDVSILLGTAGGGFGPQADFPTGDFPLSVAVGRFDADADPDLVTANVLSKDASVLLGGNAGGFDAKADFPVTPNQAVLVATGRFDPGSDLDLAVTDNTGKVWVLLGGPGGSFGAPAAVATGLSQFGLAVGNLNPGSDPDLALGSGASGVSVLLGGPGGSFGAATTFPTGLSPTGSAIADFNGDSNNDIVFADQDSGTFSVLVADLLRNSNAEADAGSDDGLDDVDLTNWTETGATTAVQYGAAGFPSDAQGAALGGGANFFAGGSGAATSTATQNWTVPASSADEVDAGGVTANLSGHLGGFADQSDDASVSATFLDAGGARLDSFRIGPVTAAQRGNATGLLYRSNDAAVPVGTRKVRVRQTFRRLSPGASNDGYADNLVLTLSGL